MHTWTNIKSCNLWSHGFPNSSSFSRSLECSIFSGPFKRAKSQTHSSTNFTAHNEPAHSSTCNCRAKSHTLKRRPNCLPYKSSSYSQCCPNRQPFFGAKPSPNCFASNELAFDRGSSGPNYVDTFAGPIHFSTLGSAILGPSYKGALQGSVCG